MRLRGSGTFDQTEQQPTKGINSEIRQKIRIIIAFVQRCINTGQLSQSFIFRI